ncbi:MAG TPA: acetamidase/formamidase family protein [Bryobacteraceae bacterium]|nr:acetamidase/formamidase family protein [Bryobacteraceae bacterium]
MQKALAFLVFLLIGALQAEPYYRTFYNKHPVKQRVRQGEVVAAKTLDSSGKDWEGKEQSDGPNPLTGPFYIEGAEPGDAVVIRFHKMRLNRDWGYSSYRLGLFAMTPEYIEKTYPPVYKRDIVRKGYAHYVPWDLDREKGLVRLREPGSKAISMEFPAKPMLGCVGVAAPGDWAPTSSPSGSYGGNLDYNRIGEGATVILPVYHPGALLFLGDGHALQGDGEPTGNGVETSMDVEFSVTVRKAAKLTGPRVETPEAVISIGSQPEFQSSLDRALEMATTDMVQYLMADFGLEEWAAHLLIAFQGKYEVVTARGSMALVIPRSALRKR